MMGMAGPWITLAYILCIVSALCCVGWGVARWNRDEPDEPETEIRHWAEEEDRVEDEF